MESLLKDRRWKAIVLLFTFSKDVLTCSAKSTSHLLARQTLLSSSGCAIVNPSHSPSQKKNLFFLHHLFFWELQPHAARLSSHSFSTHFLLNPKHLFIAVNSTSSSLKSVKSHGCHWSLFCILYKHAHQPVLIEATRSESCYNSSPVALSLLHDLLGPGSVI